MKHVQLGAALALAAACALPAMARAEGGFTVSSAFSMNWACTGNGCKKDGGQSQCGYGGMGAYGQQMYNPYMGMQYGGFPYGSPYGGFQQPCFGCYPLGGMGGMGGMDGGMFSAPFGGLELAPAPKQDDSKAPKAIEK